MNEITKGFVNCDVICFKKHKMIIYNVHVYVHIYMCM